MASETASPLSPPWLMHPWTIRTLEANRCRIPRIITRNDTADVHRLDSTPTPNWLHGGAHHLHTHPLAPTTVPFGCVSESNRVARPGDVTGRSGWGPESLGTIVSGDVSLWRRPFRGRALLETHPLGGRRWCDSSELEGEVAGQPLALLSRKPFKRRSSGCPHRELLLVFPEWCF